MAVKTKVLALANKINAALSGGLIRIKPTDPEYRILEPVTSDEEAELALHLEVRKPMSVAEIAKRAKRDPEEVERVLFKMACDGSIKFERVGNENHYFLELFVPGAMEYLVANKENVEKYPVIAECFEEYTRKVGQLMIGNIPLGLGVMRVIPIGSSIDGDSKRASYEEIETLLNNHTVFSVGDCPCRKTMRAKGQGCGHTYKDICLMMGNSAEYYIRTGRGKAITREEAFAVIERAEKEGLVHQISNLNGPDKSQAICNCCGCSCFGLRNANYFRNPDFSRSNYVASVDKTKCVACGECVENCQVNALTLGENICKPAALVGPKKEKGTPRDTVWGPDKWNPDWKHRQVVDAAGTSPCKAECPAHIAIQGYIKMASQGRYREALELIKKENPFPAVCGRICPRGCESACTRSGLDEALAVDEIKKFIADQDLNSAHRYVPEKIFDRPERIAVIGAGPAGLSCAYFLAINGYKVTVFEKQAKLGGMLTLGIPSFRLDKKVVQSEIEVLRELGVEFKTGVEVGKDLSLDDLRRQGFKAFYLAIGAQSGRKLGIEGEEAKGVMTGVDFLRAVNLDEAVKLDGPVVVIGGGNVAIDVARTATRVGAANVQMFCLESRKEMPALAEEIEEALSEGIVIDNSWGPKRFVVENGKVVGVEFQRCTSVFDENKRFNPKFDPSETKMVKASYILSSVGQGIDWGSLVAGSAIQINPNHTVKADPLTFQTGASDVFAGGDALTGPKFAIDAIAVGKQGSISIHRYVQGDNLRLGREREYHALDKANLNLEGYDRLPRQRPIHVDGEKSRKSFADLRTTFTEEQIKQETLRCLSCGAVVVDQFQCVGCGQCTIQCKFSAISLERKYDAPGVAFDEFKPLVIKHAIKRQGKIAAKAVKSLFSGD
jgi:NADPH-dependent glutamate synthase beta subunit-like oxidoreductase/NAD-dependent dihydropyrimidine dehydrogenase PreA subunit